MNQVPPRAIAVTGGKGGVGKTSVALNLALALAQRDKKVLLFDADLGLGNLDIMLGLNPKYNLGHVVRGSHRLEQILMDGPSGITILPASSGVASMADLDSRSRAALISAVGELQEHYDHLIVDTAAGVSSDVIAFSTAAQHLLVILTNEPAAMTDAYGLIKILSRDHGCRRFEVLANQVAHEAEGKALFDRFCQVADRFLDVSLGYAGSIPLDPALRQTARAQRALMITLPNSPAARAFHQLAQTILHWPPVTSNPGQPAFFMERLLQSGEATQ